MVVDIIIIAILLVFTIIGTKKGFVFSILSFFGLSVNAFLAFLLTKPFISLLGSFGLTGAIRNGYISRMTQMAGFDTNLVGLNAQELNNHVTESINNSGFSGITKTFTNLFCKIKPEQIADRESVTLTDILSKAYSAFWITLISFLVAFALIYLTLFVISRLVKGAKEHKSFNAIDNSLGFLFGLIRGALYVCVLMGIIALFREDGILSNLIEYIKSAKIGSWVYSIINPFVDNYINFENIINAARGVVPA